MEERLYENGVLEPITVQEEGVIGYTVNPNWGKRYLGYILTHIICKNVKDALKENYIERLHYYCSTPLFDLTSKGTECCIRYLEKNGYEPFIMVNVMKQENDILNEIERIECGIAEDDLSAEEWLDIAKAELEWEEENKEELESMRAEIEKEEKEIEEIKKAKDKKRFQDLL